VTVTKYTYELEDRQEEFSFAYIQAVAAAAGYKVTSAGRDRDSVDLNIDQHVCEPDYPMIPTLRVQVKCTWAHKPKPDGYIHYPLKIKNYNDLRQANVGIPCILVVLYIPNQNPASWLVEDDDSMILHNTAHWLSLRGEEAVSNKTHRTVLIPQSQRFDVDELRDIMNRLARGVMP